MNDRKTHIIMIVALTFLVLSLFGLIWGIQTTFDQSPVYDCRIAEISPDIPVSVKESCRKRRIQ